MPAGSNPALIAIVGRSHRGRVHAVGNRKVALCASQGFESLSPRHNFVLVAQWRMHTATDRGSYGFESCRGRHMGWLVYWQHSRLWPCENRFDSGTSHQNMP